jgi:hypothetical protein
VDRPPAGTAAAPRAPVAAIARAKAREARPQDLDFVHRQPRGRTSPVFLCSIDADEPHDGGADQAEPAGVSIVRPSGLSRASSSRACSGQSRRADDLAPGLRRRPGRLRLDEDGRRRRGHPHRDRRLGTGLARPLPTGTAAPPLMADSYQPTPLRWTRSHYVSIRTSKMTGHLFPVRKKVPRALE